MRRVWIGLAVAGLAVTACGTDDGTAGKTPSASPPTTTLSTPATPSETPTSSCPAATALPMGATLVTATVHGTTVTTAHQTWSVKVGSAVRIAVTADIADEVHVHGYDKKADTTPGCPTAIDLVATIPGSVEVELEHKGLHLFDLKAS